MKSLGDVKVKLLSFSLRPTSAQGRSYLVLIRCEGEWVSGKDLLARIKFLVFFLTGNRTPTSQFVARLFVWGHTTVLWNFYLLVL